jgi:hypothetical protein
MDAVLAATLVAGLGLVGNADQSGRRKVALIEREFWETLMRTVHGSAHPSARRPAANCCARWQLPVRPVKIQRR